jgi:hypothetical protein
MKCGGNNLTSRRKQTGHAAAFISGAFLLSKKA